MNRFKLAALVVSVILTAVACDEKLSDIAGPTPTLAPTLSSIQANIFSAADSSGRLSCVQCHTNVGRTPSAGLNLIAGQSYAALVGRNSNAKAGAVFVVPGDPDNSYLLRKLNGAPDIVGLRMPRNNGPFLTAGQISIIRRWIQLGAKND